MCVCVEHDLLANDFRSMYKECQNIKNTKTIFLPIKSTERFHLLVIILITIRVQNELFQCRQMSDNWPAYYEVLPALTCP